MIILSRRVGVRLAFAAVATFSIPTANSNGVNPPRPAGGSILQAECMLRASAEQLVVRRALFVVQGRQATLPLRSRETGDVTLDLEDIRTLQIPSTKLDATGSIKVQASLLVPEFSGSAYMKPGTKATAIEVAGYDNSRTRRKVLLTDCSTLTVSRQDALHHEQLRREEVKK